MLSDASARKAQSDWQSSRSDRDFDILYKECLVLAKDRLSYLLYKTHYEMDVDKQEMVAKDAVSHLLEYYLRRPDYTVRYFNQRILQELRRILYSRHGILSSDRKWEARCAQWDDTVMTMQAPEPEPKVEIQYSMQDILDEHEQGSRIVLDLYMSRSYKSAILTVAKYVTKRWIYDHAEQLYTVYKLTRRKGRE